MQLSGISLVRFKKGETIFLEGDEANGVYIVDKGGVLIFKTMPDREIVLAERAAGEIFGEMALVDGKPRSASARAKEDTMCYVINDKQFDQYIQEMHPIVYQMFRSLTKTIRDNNETLTLLHNILQLRQDLP